MSKKQIPGCPLNLLWHLNSLGLVPQLKLLYRMTNPFPHRDWSRLSAREAKKLLHLCDVLSRLKQGEENANLRHIQHSPLVHGECRHLPFKNSSLMGIKEGHRLHRHMHLKRKEKEYLFILRKYLKVIRTQSYDKRRSFRKRFNVPNGPDAKPFASTSPNSNRQRSVDDNRVGNVEPMQTVVTSENVAKVSGFVQQNPRNTVRRIASETGLKRSSTQNILRNSLRMFPYKIQSHQAIPIKSVRQRFEFANEILTMIDNE
ncbi:hypothetical protein AVEN_204413-1 [Araneus ventricosus]|uniref:DUF4817 domain-containing protein n=1 Tax=Araneus ventricosus TaxID=182803 RepID=A0A4Y2LVT3_ARAVE|nr:hypothetical protein AVEN_204413-1 [Araneus ventricosus]